MLDLSSSIILFISGVVGWFIYKVYIWPYYLSPLRNIPGPPSDNPFYGNFRGLFSNTSSETQHEWVKKYGSIVKYHGILNEPSLFIADTKIVQEVTINHVYDYIKPPRMIAGGVAIAGRGLVFSEGEDHKRQRKMMNPAFTHNNVKEMVPTFVRVASTLKGLLEDEINIKPEINLTPYISKTTLDIIGLVGFSYEFNSLTSPNELAEAYESLMNAPVTTSRIVTNVLSNYIPFFRRIPIKLNREFSSACKTIERVSNKLIEEKYHESKNGKLDGNDLLSLLININKTLPIEEKMTDKELRYQIMTFLLAGHETTSVTICWALHLLAQQPHEQDSLREELVKAFPDKSKFDPTFDEINSLEYLNCVVKETLRLYTPIPISGRSNVKDEVLGGHFVPKDTQILLGTVVLQTLPSIWGPTADDFDPKRWLDPSLIKNVSNLNYSPFLNGTRSCIGNKVALTEFKIVLSMLVRNFVFKPIEGLHISKRTFPVTKPDPYLGLMVSRVEA